MLGMCGQALCTELHTQAVRRSRVCVCKSSLPCYNNHSNRNEMCLHLISDEAYHDVWCSTGPYSSVCTSTHADNVTDRQRIIDAPAHSVDFKSLSHLYTVLYMCIIRTYLFHLPSCIWSTTLPLTAWTNIILCALVACLLSLGRWWTRECYTAFARTPDRIEQGDIHNLVLYIGEGFFTISQNKLCCRVNV